MSRVRAKIIFCLTYILILPLNFIEPASAVPATPVVTSPSSVDFSGSTWTAGSFGISGYSVDAPSSMDILVSISLAGAPTGDSLTIRSRSNLTLSYGYSASTWDSFTVVTFTGVKADINNALTSTNFRYLSAAPDKAQISVSGVKKNQRVRVTVRSK